MTPIASLDVKCTIRDFIENALIWL